MTTTMTYQVEGMTCGHCVSSVTAEVERVPGVSAVQVDLSARAVTVTSAAPLDDTLIDAAVVEAGYQFAGRVDKQLITLTEAGGSCCGSGGCN